MTSPKILTFDIETSPNFGGIWGLFNQNIGIGQLTDVTRMICFAAKWHHEKKVQFYSEFHNGREEMIRKAYELFDDADIVIGWNSKGFDVKHFKREFAKEGLTSPSPFKQIDLMHEVRREFRMTSNKLAFVAEYFGLHPKESNEGYGLWTKCLAGDAKAWAKMRSYNINDVKATEDIYDYLNSRGWIKHPHVGLYTGEEGVCGNCGSQDLKRRGYAYTDLSKFPRYRCGNCGRWSRGKRAVARVDERPVAA